MIKLKDYKIILILFFLLLVSCKENEEIEMDKMVSIYVDLLVADQTHDNNLDSLQYYKTLVYNNHGIAKSEFENTFLSYKADEEKWDKFFDLALAKVDTLEAIRKRNDTR